VESATPSVLTPTIGGCRSDAGKGITLQATLYQTMRRNLSETFACAPAKLRVAIKRTECARNRNRKRQERARKRRGKSVRGREGKSVRGREEVRVGEEEKRQECARKRRDKSVRGREEVRVCEEEVTRAIKSVRGRRTG
jgi:hypothetical protein